MLTIVVACLTTLVALANVSDTLLAKTGDRRIRQRLVDFYLEVESDWRGSYRRPALLLGHFMRGLLGERPMLAALRFTLISLAIFALTLVGAAYSLLQYAGYADSARQIGELVPRLAACNLVSDAISWFGAIYIIRRMETASAPAAVLWILAAIGIWLLAWAIQMELIFTVLLYSGWFGEARLPAQLPEYALRALEFAVASLWAMGGEFDGQIFSEYYPISRAFGIVAAIPILIYAVSTVAGVIIFWLRPVLQRPLAGFLTRIEASDKPVLTTVAIALSAVTTILAVWMKALSGRAG